MYHIDDIPSMHDVGRQHGHHWPFYPIALQKPLHDGILFALRLRTNSPTCQDELILPNTLAQATQKSRAAVFQSRMNCLQICFVKGRFPYDVAPLFL